MIFSRGGLVLAFNVFAWLILCDFGFLLCLLELGAFCGFMLLVFARWCLEDFFYNIAHCRLVPKMRCLKERQREIVTPQAANNRKDGLSQAQLSLNLYDTDPKKKIFGL